MSAESLPLRRWAMAAACAAVSPGTPSREGESGAAFAVAEDALFWFDAESGGGAREVDAGAAGVARDCGAESVAGAGAAVEVDALGVE